MKNEIQDLVIVGGGIMGLMTAYYASQFSQKITIVEKRSIGNQYSASSGYSRSIRNDYLDPFDARLASESQKMWKSLEEDFKKKFIIKCGVLNIANKYVTNNPSQTYAQKSFGILQMLGFPTCLYKNKQVLQSTFPQFNADFGCLDLDAGMLYIPTILAALTNGLKKKKVNIREYSEVVKIKKTAQNINIYLKTGQQFKAKNAVIAVGAWSIEVVKKVEGSFGLKLPIIPIPQELDYFEISKDQSESFSSNQMPVFAYLDVGIYGHPLYGNSPGLKVAYFDPLGAKLVKSSFKPQKQNKIKSNIDFIRHCIPRLKKIQLVKKEKNYYDMTPDNNFIVDELPVFKNIFIAGGFCGTGFKFAPLVGRIMAEMAFRQGTIYDIKKFSIKRFGKLTNLTFLKTIPMYSKFVYPNNWQYLKMGINAFTKLKLP